MTFSYANRLQIALPLVIDEDDLWRAAEIIERSTNGLADIEGEIM